VGSDTGITVEEFLLSRDLNLAGNSRFHLSSRLSSCPEPSPYDGLVPIKCVLHSALIIATVPCKRGDVSIKSIQQMTK